MCIACYGVPTVRVGAPPPSNALLARQVYIFFTTKSTRMKMAAQKPLLKNNNRATVVPAEGTRSPFGTATTAVVAVNKLSSASIKALTKDVSKKKGLRESDLLEDDMMHHDKKALEGTGEDEGPPPSIAMRRIKWERIFYQARLCRPCTHSRMYCHAGDEQPIRLFGSTQTVTLSAPATITAAPTCRNPHQMDNDLRGFLHEEEAVAFYTFIRLDLTQKEIKNKAHEMESDDQMIVLSEFIKVSETLLGKVTGERTPLRDLNPASMLPPTGLAHMPPTCALPLW